MESRREFIKILASIFGANFASREANSDAMYFSNSLDKSTLRSTIEMSVSQANIQELYDPWYGDCWHIAVALHDLFPRVYIRGTEWEGSSWNGPGHVFVEFDGGYYDGTGKVTIEQFKETWSDMIPEVKEYDRDFITKVHYYEEDKKLDIESRIKSTPAYNNWNKKYELNSKY